MLGIQCSFPLVVSHHLEKAILIGDARGIRSQHPFIYDRNEHDADVWQRFSIQCDHAFNLFVESRVTATRGQSENACRHDEKSRSERDYRHSKTQEEWIVNLARQ